MPSILPPYVPPRPTRLSAVETLAPAHDVTAFAWLLVWLGAAASFGAIVLPTVSSRLFMLALGLVVLGVGLVRRQAWARAAAIVAFLYTILAQMGSRWFESDPWRLFIEAFSGVHALQPIGASPMVSLRTGRSVNLAASVPGAFLGLVICAVLAWFTWRLLSEPVRAEFTTRARR